MNTSHKSSMGHGSLVILEVILHPVTVKLISVMTSACRVDRLSTVFWMINVATLMNGCMKEGNRFLTLATFPP